MVHTQHMSQGTCRDKQRWLGKSWPWYLPIMLCTAPQSSTVVAVTVIHHTEQRDSFDMYERKFCGLADRSLLWEEKEKKKRLSRFFASGVVLWRRNTKIFFRAGLACCSLQTNEGTVAEIIFTTFTYQNSQHAFGLSVEARLVRAKVL